MYSYPHKEDGFTLLELMVVLAIMSVIAAMTTPNMMAEVNLRRADLSIEDTQTLMDAARAYRIKKEAGQGTQHARTL